ncbi:hypothetical protein CPB84DRAFT_275706 [Gymnopilus junonius]|uniref:Uncharacterized protein n=1 Tax=Gymnopilus junonius TaxID=109634 RepID=A0A9P5ND28_GYMJU|nr:hypothetical protein CPB84DRAFT_275706 [Gymnopilus junonius]
MPRVLTGGNRTRTRPLSNIRAPRGPRTRASPSTTAQGITPTQPSPTPGSLSRQIQRIHKRKRGVHTGKRRAHERS